MKTIFGVTVFYVALATLGTLATYATFYTLENGVMNTAREVKDSVKSVISK